MRPYQAVLLLLLACSATILLVTHRDPPRCALLTDSSVPLIDDRITPGPASADPDDD